MDDFNLNFQFQQPIPQMMMVAVPELSVPSPLPLSADPTLETLIEKQSQEIGRYIQRQNNLLRRNIQRRWKQHLATVMQCLEPRAAFILKMEVAMAENRMLQLEACLRKLEHEKDSSENAARENEALAASLGDTLEQLQSPCFSSTGREEEDRGEEEMTSSSARRELKNSGRCRICGVRISCMVLLPCRHVCCCEACDAALDLCPVCSSAKEASVEVVLSLREGI